MISPRPILGHEEFGERFGIAQGKRWQTAPVSRVTLGSVVAGIADPGCFEIITAASGITDAGYKIRCGFGAMRRQ